MDETELKKMKDQILYRSDIMRLFGVSNVTVWHWVKDGKLREHKLSRTPLYLRNEVMEDIARSGLQNRRIV